MRVVAVFGGGGAKAVAHVGAWRALEEAELEPVHVVGTSMGAVIGAALAAGLTHRAVGSVVRGVTRDDVAALAPLALIAGALTPSLLQEDRLRQTIARVVPARWFSDLKTPLTVTATDLESGELVRFGAGGLADVPLLEALYASCALPLYFPAAQLDNRRFGDGGLRAVLPLEIARDIPCDLVIAVDVGPGFDEERTPPTTDGFVPPLVRAHGEAIRIMMAAQTQWAIAAWPREGPRLLVVRPVQEREATFALESTDRYMQAGYRATKQALGSQDVLC